jgi:hypothetical protein
MSEPTYLEKLAPGQTHAESAAMIGRGSLVFLGGMALAAASIFVERFVVRAIQKT